MRTSARRDPIAIVGIGCRFPGGVKDPESFWRVLREGVDAITEIPADRFDANALFREGPPAPGRIGTRWGGFLEGIDRFDAAFFDISPREADRLDPQQRLLLETSWEALVDAGVPASQLLGSRAGVFIGLWLNDYEARLFADPAVDFHMTTGTGRYAASGRISYTLGLEGPSVTVDTACSSSLVAVHLACRSLWSGECPLALAGGANVILQPHITIAYSQSGMIAADGRCKFGDARANGYVRSEGAGMVLLKPLSRALADGDHIYALIRGSAVNNDGRSGDYMATPAQAGQEQMLRLAYEDAGISPGEVRFVEAHGTGTGAGDPVELGALGAVLGQGRRAHERCAVGSVKTNFGHTEGAAGMAGLIKTALALRHRLIPQNLHLTNPSPRIPWDSLPLLIPTEPIPLEGEAPVYAGVSSFGIAGTNAHVVLAGPPLREVPRSESRDHGAVLVPLSARTPGALTALAEAWIYRFSAEDAPALHDLAYTASCRRSHHEHRLAVVAGERAELVQRLKEYAAGENPPLTTAGHAERQVRGKVVFVFPGQGSQWDGMGRRLLDEEPAFRRVLEECERAMRPFVEWSLLEQIQLEPGAAGYLLDRIDVIQPTLVAIDIALARLWRSWGLEPEAVIGHSMGEVAAAHVAGALSLGDAMRVICLRSRLLRRTSGQGAMAAVELSRAVVQAALVGYEERVSIAASNSPRSTILSGDPAALEEILDSLAQQDVFCRRVNVDVASHSPRMDPLRAELLAALEGLGPRSAAVPFYSTVQAGEVDGAALDPAYWARNLRQPVLFSETVQRLLEEGHGVFLEVSPHPVLVTALQQVIEAGSRGGAAFASLRRHEPERERLLQALGELYVAGCPVDWTRLHPERGELVRLPSYPWQRRRHWIERGAGGGWGAPPSLPGRLLRSPAIPGWVFESRVAAEAASTFGEHRIAGAAVVPAALFVEALTAAVREALGREALAIEDLTFHRPLVLSEDGYRIVQTILHPAESSRMQVEVHSRGEDAESDEWVLHATGSLVLEDRSEGAAERSAPPPTLEEIRTRCPQELLDWSVPRTEAPHAAAGGIPIERIFRGTDEAFALLRRSGTGLDGSASAALLDACLRAMTALDGEAGTARAANGRHLVLASVRRIRFGEGGSQELVCHLLAESRGDGAPTGFLASARVLEPAGAVVAQVEGARFARVTRQALLGTRATSPDDWQYEIVWRPREVTGAAVGAAPAPGSWLVFADRTGVGQALASAVLAEGGECQLVYPADGEEQAGSDYLGQIERALETWSPAAGVPAAVVYLWGLEPPAGESSAAIQARVSSAGAGAMVLARRLDERAPAGRTRLWIVTRAGQPVREGDPIAPAQAPVWSLARGIALECPQIWGGLIDLNPQAEVERDARQLLLQMSADEEEDQVAFREDARYAPRLVRAEKLAPAAPAFRGDGAYLITGALGSLGLKLGRWLVDHGAGHLVLLGRRGLPERAEGSNLAPGSPFSSAVEAIQEIERAGAVVTTVAVDVSDVAAMARLLARFGADLPPLRSVFHAAAVMEFASLHRLQPDQIDAMLRPKVEGSWVLHQLTRDLDLDHFVLFSSASSLWGSRGMAHYAAANQFLDALAHYRRLHGLPALAINWGGWEGGATSAETTRFLELSDFRLLPPAGALEVLGQLMAAGAVQRTVAEVDWAAMRAAYEFRPGRPLLEEIEVVATTPLDETLLPTSTGLLREIEELPEDEARAFLTSHVRGEVAAVLGLERERLMEPGKGFFKLGMDSLMTVELRTRLERSLGLRLPTTIAFEYPTIEALAGYLAGELLRRIVAAEEASPAAVPAVPIDPTSLESATEAELAAMLDGAIADLLTDET